MENIANNKKIRVLDILDNIEQLNSLINLHNKETRSTLMVKQYQTMREQFLAELKTIFLFLTFTFLLFLQNIQAQVTIKGALGIKITYPMKAIADFALEYHILKRLSVQLSSTNYATKFGDSGSFLNQKMLSPQIRFYPIVQPPISPFIGIIGQRYSSKDHNLNYDGTPYELTDYSGLGGGFIGGFQFSFKKHWGLDLHFAFVNLKGNQIQLKRDPKTMIAVMSETKNLQKTRLIWGLNFTFDMNFKEKNK
jgi:hypothetical protein